MEEKAKAEGAPVWVVRNLDGSSKVELQYPITLGSEEISAITLRPIVGGDLLIMDMPLGDVGKTHEFLSALSGLPPEGTRKLRYVDFKRVEA